MSFLAVRLDFDDKVFERYLFLCFLILRGKTWFKGEKERNQCNISMLQHNT